MIIRKVCVCGLYKSLDNPLSFEVHDDGNIIGPTSFRIKKETVDKQGNVIKTEIETKTTSKILEALKHGEHIHED